MRVFGVTHEKLVKVSVPKRTSFVGARLRFSTGSHRGFTRVLFGLDRPIGKSVIRALRHTIEFDSGLLIRHLDLQHRDQRQSAGCTQ
jgi:hypothetical protein